MSKVVFDGENKTVQINTGETDINFEIDIYQEWKQWVVAGNTQYAPYIKKIGGNEIVDSTLYLPSAYLIYNGWKIIPQQANHILTITGNVFTQDGSTIYELPIGFQVVVNLKSDEGGLNIIEHNMLKEVWQLMGLDKDFPLSVSKTERRTAGIDQNIEETGNTTNNIVTVTRI